MDAILRRLQSFVEKVAFVRFRTLPVWMGVGRLAGSQFGGLGAGQKLRNRGSTVARVIEFYVPETFRPRAFRLQERGRLIEFNSQMVYAPDSNGGETLYESRPDSLLAVVELKKAP